MALDKKTLELVAIGASIGSECGECLEDHLKTAREAGATPGEICNAIRVAEEVRQLHARIDEKFLLKVRDIVEELGGMRTSDKVIEKPSSSGLKERNLYQLIFTLQN